MGYAVYEDQAARSNGIERWAGYGVPAECDHPECAAKINRGMAYKCEGEGEGDCEFFFCEPHQYHPDHEHLNVVGKPDSSEWELHMLTDDSWDQWRHDNPERVTAMRERQNLAQ